MVQSGGSRFAVKNLWVWVLFLMVLAGMAGCQGNTSTPTATLTLPPTYTRTPTLTALPTETPTPTVTPTPLPAANQLEFPLRIIYYQPWRSTDWREIRGVPARGRYDSRDADIVREQIAEMKYGGAQAGMVLWRGPEDDEMLQAILDASLDEDFYWAVFLDDEKTGDPTVGEINLKLEYLLETFSKHPNYLYLDRRYAVFADVEELDDGCGMASRWRDGNTPQAFLVMQAFANYKTCSGQPDLWMDLIPDTPVNPPVEDSQAIVVKTWDESDLTALQRSLNDWGEAVWGLAKKNSPLEIILGYNDWATNRSIEPSDVWSDAGQYYLEVLHRFGAGYETLMEKALFGGDAVLVGAGDIAICGSPGTEETARLLDGIAGTVFTAGDNSNEVGSTLNYSQCFDPAWGRHKDRIYPAVGNHDYLTSTGAPYFNYFGERAGDPDKGYYSYDIGSWHIVVLNSVCEYEGGCGANSPQMEWLRADLAANPSECTLAIWHYPLFTSAARGGNAVVRPFWDALYEAGADVIINGHDHHYERFAQMDPNGKLDEKRGIRQFIIGTGGAGVRAIGSFADNSEYRILYTYGVLKLTLKQGSYLWEFVPQAGMGASDSGSGICR